tara:strand:+ start:18565 stop:18750 length:186 start_codon:yes stop_codon:yes gene_type:complete
MNKNTIRGLRDFFNSDWITKEDVVDIMITFISEKHLSSLLDLILNGYSLEEIKDMEVFKNE